MTFGKIMFFKSKPDPADEHAASLVNLGVTIADRAREILLPMHPEIPNILSPATSRTWHFHMALIAVAANYGLMQRTLSRENSGLLLQAIKKKMTTHQSFGVSAIAPFDTFLSAWWGLKHVPEPAKLDIPTIVGVWFLKSIGRSIGESERAVARGIGAYMIAAHLK